MTMNTRTLLRRNLEARPAENLSNVKAHHLARAIGLALAASTLGVMAPMAAHAQSISCPVTTAVTVDRQASIASGANCDINALGSVTINTSGSFTNAGTLHDHAGASLNNAGALNNSGQLSNDGTLMNQGGGSLTNSAGLSNANGAILSNAGTLTNQAGGALANQAGGTLTNTFLLYNDHGAVLSNAGSLTNSLVILNRGSLTNQTGGTVANNSGGFYNYSGASLTNAGAFNNASLLSNRAGATLNNAGTLTSSVVVDNAGALTNQVGGMLVNDQGGLYNDSGATLTNAGTLTNTGGLVNTGTITSAGVINGAGYFLQYGGKTTVDGSLSQTGIAINAGTLAGTGTLTSPNAITEAAGASISPGDAPGAVGTLTVNAPLDLLGHLNVDVGSLASFDLLSVNGGVDFGPGSLFNFYLGDDMTQAAGNSFQFFNASSFLNLDDVMFHMSGLASDLAYSVTEVGGTGLQLNLSAAVATPVPEPGAFGVLGLGLLVLGGGLTLRKHSGARLRGESGR